MNRNQKKFEEIKQLLIEKLGDQAEYSKDEDGTEYVTVKIQISGFQQLLGNWWWVMVYIIRISAKNSKI